MDGSNSSAHVGLLLGRLIDKCMPACDSQQKQHFFELALRILSARLHADTLPTRVKDESGRLGLLEAQLQRNAALHRPDALLHVLHALAPAGRPAPRPLLSAPLPHAPALAPAQPQPSAGPLNATASTSSVEAGRDGEARVLDADAELGAVQDALWALQGVPSASVRRAGDGSELLLQAQARSGMPPVAARVLALAAELGNVQQQAQAALQGAAPGLVAQAAVAFVRSQLGQHAARVAALAQERPSLRRVAAAMAGLEAGLRRCRAAAVACCGRRGGALLAALHGLAAAAGAPDDRAFFEPLLSAASGPLLAQAGEWLRTGQLRDAWHEGFVVLLGAAAAPGPAALWHEAFGLHAPMLPPWLGARVAEQLLACGRAVAFLRGACHDERWLADVFARSEQLAGACGQLAYPRSLGAGEALARQLHRLDALLQTRLVALLQADLQAHLRRVHQYLLLHKADFAAALLAAHVPNGSADKHRLVAMLEDALAAGGPPHGSAEQRAVLQALDIEPVLDAPGFALRYRLDAASPLHALLPAELWRTAGAAFRAVFRALLVHAGLLEAFRAHQQLARMAPGLAAALHQARLTSHHMLQLLARLLEHLTGSVLAREWVQLEAHLRGAKDMSAMEAAVLTYATSVAAGTTLPGDAGVAVGELLQVCEQWAVLQRQLAAAVEARAAAAGQWGSAPHLAPAAEVQLRRLQTAFAAALAHLRGALARADGPLNLPLDLLQPIVAE